MSNSKNRRALGISVTLGLALSMILAACGGDSGSSSDGDQVRIGGTSAYAPTLPAFSAAQGGAFEDAGIDAEVTNYEGGSVSLEALAAGEADLINYFPPGVAEASLEGVDSVIVAAGSPRAVGWSLVVPTDSDIQSVEDLAGKKIGVTAIGATTDYYAREVARQAGIEAEYVPVGGAGLISALKNGNVDAIVAIPPGTYQIEEEGIGRTLVDFEQEESLLLPDVWVASRELAEDNPELLERTLAVMFGEVQKLQRDRKFGVQQVVDIAGYEEATAERTWEETIGGLSKDGAFTEEEMQTSIDLAANGESDGDLPSAADISTTEFIPVKPEQAQ